MERKEKRDRFELTKGALLLLARMVISCQFKDEQHEKYLVFRWKEMGKNGKKNFVSLNDLLDAIAKPQDMYRYLIAIAEQKNKFRGEKRLIDEEVVFSYFGGKKHVEKITGALDGPDFEGYGPEVKLRNLFVHMLLPVVITGQDGKFWKAVYKNKNCTVTLGHLVPFGEDKDKIHVGQTVLSHFASIIAVNSDKNLRDHLRLEQASSKRFAEAIKFFDGKEVSQEALAEKTARLMEFYNM